MKEKPQTNNQPRMQRKVKINQDERRLSRVEKDTQEKKRKKEVTINAGIQPVNQIDS